MVKKVIILGGGSAGFLAVLALKLKLPELHVCVVRSRDIGIIGVGEGSTVVLTEFLHTYLGIELARFHEIAKPTWKLGLRFIWGPRPYFNYTFGPGLEVRAHHSIPRPSGFFCDDDIEYTDPYSAAMTLNRVFARKDGLPILHEAIAYHFENEKFVTFLEGAARAIGVEIIEDTVIRVLQDDAGVTGLEMASGVTRSADLYVDASGFRSELLGRALGEPFVTYGASLFCERAVVGGWNRADSPDPQDQIIKPYTTCETMDAGWAWQIEHEHRINRGYVYCPAFISDDEAEREFRTKNPRIGPTRIVKFVSGRYERAWVKNVVAVGNASGFVEPLEATALGVIAMQSRHLAETLLGSNRQPRPTQAAMFNRFHALNWDGIRDFLAVHYKFNTRLDTPFWRHCREATDLAGAAPMVAYFQENGPDGYWGPTAINNVHDQFTAGSYITLLVGMKTPYQGMWTPTAEQSSRFNELRRSFRQIAEGAMTVREALAAIRSPRWRWQPRK